MSGMMSIEFTYEDAVRLDLICNTEEHIHHQDIAACYHQGNNIFNINSYSGLFPPGIQVITGTRAYGISRPACFIAINNNGNPISHLHALYIDVCDNGKSTEKNNLGCGSQCGTSLALYHTWVCNCVVCRCVIVCPRSHMLILAQKIVLQLKIVLLVATDNEEMSISIFFILI